MSTTGKIAETALSAGIVLTYAGKYGLQFTGGLSAKIYEGGVKNLANSFAQGIDFGIGSYIVEQAGKATNWGIEQAIKFQKFLKSKIR